MSIYSTFKSFWGCVIALILICFSINGCKVKQVTRDKTKVDYSQNYDHLALIDFINKNQQTKELSETEIKEFKEFVSNLNINYDGKDLNDKMDVLLKKLADGTTQLTLQGKGTANYNQTDKTQFEALQKYFKSYQDSIQQVNSRNQEQLKNDLFNRIDERTKQVDSKTFTWQLWLLIGLAVVIGIFLRWGKGLFRGPK